MIHCGYPIVQHFGPIPAYHQQFKHTISTQWIKVPMDTHIDLHILIIYNHNIYIIIYTILWTNPDQYSHLWLYIFVAFERKRRGKVVSRCGRQRGKGAHSEFSETSEISGCSVSKRWCPVSWDLVHAHYRSWCQVHVNHVNIKPTIDIYIIWYCIYYIYP